MMIIPNVTVVGVVPGRYRELLVSWPAPVGIVGDPTASMSLSLFQDPLVVLGDKGDLAFIDGRFLFRKGELL